MNQNHYNSIEAAILSPEEKNMLDDLPDQAVEQFFSIQPSQNAGIEKLTLNVVTEDGIEQAVFEGARFFLVYDYLEYLMLGGYRPIVPTYSKESAYSKGGSHE